MPTPSGHPVFSKPFLDSRFRGNDTHGMKKNPDF